MEDVPYISRSEGRIPSHGTRAPGDKKRCTPSWMTVGFRLWPVRGPTVSL
jgi:hypothetical protein